ncbi:MAG: hypothetical protein R3D98_00600 [Candidatus Krumholzibacteriia bacterium]
MSGGFGTIASPAARRSVPAATVSGRRAPRCWSTGVRTGAPRDISLSCFSCASRRVVEAQDITARIGYFSSTIFSVASPFAVCSLTK